MSILKDLIQRDWKIKQIETELSKKKYKVHKRPLLTITSGERWAANKDLLWLVKDPTTKAERWYLANKDDINLKIITKPWSSEKSSEKSKQFPTCNIVAVMDVEENLILIDIVQY